MDDALIIFLHGVGSRGADLAGLAKAWQGVLPNTQFATPDAPHPFDGGGSGHQWFSVSGVTEANRPARIAEARAGFDQVLQVELERYGFAGRLQRVALVGFSQGSIMALDAIVSGRWPVGAVVAFSGRLASPLPWQPATQVPLLLAHGGLDPVMPVGLCDEAEAELRALGFAVARHDSPQAGHQITPPAAQAAAQFLLQALAAPKAMQRVEN